MYLGPSAHYLCDLCSQFPFLSLSRLICNLGATASLEVIVTRCEDHLTLLVCPWLKEFLRCRAFSFFIKKSGVRWVSVALRGFSLAALSRGCSLLRSVAFLLRGPLLLRTMGSRCAGFSSCSSWALEGGLGSCGP